MPTTDDMAWWSDVVASAYGCRELDAFVATVLPRMSAQFRSLATSCDELHLRTGEYRLLGFLSDVALPDHRPHMHENPNASALIGAPRSATLQTRDTISTDDWHRTAFYQHVARPMGWDDQALISFHTGRWLGAIGLHRDEKFQSDERFLMELLRPHFQAVMVRLHPAEQTDGERRVYQFSLSASLAMASPSPIYEWLMQQYFPNETRHAGLPLKLRDHLLRHLRPLGGLACTAPMKKLRARSARGELAIRCFPHQADGRVVLEMEETLNGTTRSACTQRECEVLHWIREGKRDAEIAVILGISAKTVGKHIEHILAKTGAANRTAAAIGSSEK